ncbi:LCP family protein [Intrasporangium sp. YIM S08009]|uniref:LCP family protein n=1 Tax=Intrasporangium zincisolvens TaxID=3080018 RepID=UPI002B060182|nr:LCP family protein [Intrasporangium sp. YIM S08009]
MPVEPDAAGSRTRGEQRLDRRSGFRRAVGLTLLGTVVPGAGLTQTRSRVLGWVLLGLTLFLAAVAAFTVLSMGPTRAALGLVARPGLLLALAVAVAVLGTVWCGSVVLTAVRARPASLDRGRTRALAAVATVLALVVAGGSVTTAQYVLITRDTVTDVFAAPVTRPPGAGVTVDDGDDPWATQKRVNVLLLGSDAASNRDGTRTDSMIVASIDTASGRTTLISMPRNLLNTPLGANSPLLQRYPSGHFGQPDRDCAQNRPGEHGQCMLTNLWMEATAWAAGHPDAYPAGEVPGRLELRGAVEQVTGLDIDQVVVIDLRGFKQLIDAMGGVVVNVKNAATGDPLPIGGHVVAGRIVDVRDHFEPGRQRLDGFKALWYARSRAADSDTYRQARQRCVVKAIVEQVDPAQMLGQYPQLARIAKDNIYTDIAAQDLPAFVELVGRIQGSTINSVTLTRPDGVVPEDPDYDHVRVLVQEGIAPPKPAPTPTPTSTDASTPTGTSKPAKTPPATPSPTTTPYSQC